MFSKVLIANRGEIACRVMRTARRMGIATVAVYSEADAVAPHVEMADEAVYLGPPPPAQSYLAADKILAALKETKAEAVHPGFGFLSENADFARAVIAAGAAFVGPPPDAIAAMGDKIASKRLAAQAGVNTIPGHGEAVPDIEAARTIAEGIGYPLMIKASAGGGGKGMRIARGPGDLDEGFRGARNEARQSFGDDRILLERYIDQPRHIEIQVLGDTAGNIVHLFERECSVQRRHQKVIEEAPSPFMTEAMRAEMGAQAVRLCEAVGYYSAGTVEFVVGADCDFYFLEMNTRLQVEHPVTEAITGLDIVEQMFRVAAGEPLGFKQNEIPLKGWAVEARIYAEDPARNFAPSIGRLTRFKVPHGPGIRIDTGVVEGSEVTMYYDPMIAKLVAHGNDRAEAIGRLGAALDGMYVRGVNHNIPFLASVLARPRFHAGDLTTNFIADEYGDGFDPGTLTDSTRAVIIASAVAIHAVEADRAVPANGAGYAPPEDWVVSFGDEEHFVRVLKADGGFDVDWGDKPLAVRGEVRLGAPIFAAEIDGASVRVQIDRLLEGYRLSHGGASLKVLVRSQRAALFAARMPKKEPPDLSKFLLSPMPGLMVAIAVSPGALVKGGEELCVVDAMKMENVLRAERDTTVKSVKVAVGESVAVDQVLMEFE